jgi:hypothetical protein
MAVIDRFRFKGKDHGLLVVLFPGVPILTTFYEFVTNKRVIVISEDEPFTRYPKKEVIQITSRATLALDTREGFLRTLAKRGVRASDYQCWLLLHDMSEEEFWYIAKIAVVLKYFPNVPTEASHNKQSTVLDLFQSLFQDFGDVYRHYHSLRKSRSARNILYVLMDMNVKARDLHKYAVSPYYRKVLRENRKYVPLFRMSLHMWLRAFRHTPRGYLPEAKFNEDAAMWSFLWRCTAYKIPDCDVFQNESVAMYLRQWGYSEQNIQQLLPYFPGALI